MEVVIKELDNTENYLEYCNLLKQLTTINTNNFTLDDFQKQLSTIFSNPYHKIFIAKIDNKIVGSITLLIEPKIIHDLSTIAHIEDVVVDSTYRSKGIGKKLILKAIEIAKNIGCYKIILDCEEDKIPFYKRCGFIEKDRHMALYL